MSHMNSHEYSAADYIVFPDFYIYRNETGWRWVSNDATKSSAAAFDSAPHCALNAERTFRPVSDKRRPA